MSPKRQNAPTPDLRLPDAAQSRLFEVVFRPSEPELVNSDLPALDTSELRVSRLGTHLFLGEVQIKLDDKYRFTVPPAFRPLFSDPGGAIFTRSPDGCVWAFSMTEYRRIISDILTAGAVSPETRILHRYLTSYAYIIPEPDSYNRLRLSQEIRNLVYGESASKDLLLKGGGNLVELWSVDRWTDYLKSFSDV